MQVAACNRSSKASSDAGIELVCNDILSNNISDLCNATLDATVSFATQVNSRDLDWLVADEGQIALPILQKKKDQLKPTNGKTFKKPCNLASFR